MNDEKVMSLLLVLFVSLLSGCSLKNHTTENAESYEKLIFDDTRVHSIDITMSKEDREDQLAKPTDKTKYKANVVIDGEKMENVALNTKGNSSLYLTDYAGKDKFSYGINFGSYQKGQTYHGLDKLTLQNNCADATSMKDYMSYYLFRKMGVNAPLASYTWLTINGEDQGLYTILEKVEDSFLNRTANGQGTLYKPEEESMGLKKMKCKKS